MGKKGKKEPSKQNLRNALKYNNLMKMNHVLANGWVTALVILLLDVGVFLLFNYALNILFQLPTFIRKSVNEKATIDYSLSNLKVNKEFLQQNSVLYLLLVLFLLFVDIKLIYQIQINFRDFNKGQKGTMRWTTISEIQEQYKSIPDIGKTVTDYFPGNGGVPICHYEDKYYIDNSGVHTLILGITRSGKGEMFVTTMIDIYSRATEKASMVINDPKLELCAMSYETLEKRGYEVHVLNLIQPVNSMGFNPLSLITEFYKKGEIEEAEMLASTFCYSIFNSEDSQNGQNQYFYDNATYCLSAFIFAMITDCLELDRKENEKRKASWERKKKAFLELPETEQKEVEETFSQIKKLKEGLKHSKDLTEQKEAKEKIKKLEQKVSLYEIGEFVPSCENEKKITMTSIINTISELSRIKLDKEGKTSMVDLYFSSRPEMDRAKLLFSAIEITGGESKGSIYSTMLSKLLLFTYHSISKMTAETTVNIEDIGFGEKPVAIFMGTPDYDHSKDFIASVFVRQVSFVLSKKATLTPNGKCKREVIFHLDEVGSMPKIEGFASEITVALGRNIRYNLFIQSYAQIESKYGDDSKTIIGNCGNQIYIQSSDTDSAEHFSKLVGKETITTFNRLGGKFSLHKTFTEMLEEHPLITPDDLTNMIEGENVINRVMKRTDLRGRDVRPYPIYNRKATGTDMPYRYTFLEKYFPSGRLISEVTKESRLLVDGNNVFDVKKKVEEIINQYSSGENLDAATTIQKNMIFTRYKLKPLTEVEESTLLSFFNENIAILNVTWEEFMECTIDDIFEYLQTINKPILALKWQDIVINYFSNQETETVIVENAEEISINNEELESDYQQKEEVEAEDELDIENKKIASLSNRSDIISFVWNNGDSDLLDLKEIEEDTDILEMTVCEARELIPPEWQGYFNNVIERGMK